MNWDIRSVEGSLCFIPLLPFVGAVLLRLFGRALGRQSVSLIGCATVFGSLVGLSIFSCPCCPLVVHHLNLGNQTIQPQADGTFQVHFGNGKIVKVEPVTDAELIMGASEGRDHGVWLSVLEKAYAQIGAAVV